MRAIIVEDCYSCPYAYLAISTNWPRAYYRCNHPAGRGAILGYVADQLKGQVPCLCPLPTLEAVRRGYYGPPEHVIFDKGGVNHVGAQSDGQGAY